MGSLKFIFTCLKNSPFPFAFPAEEPRDQSLIREFDFPPKRTTTLCADFLHNSPIIKTTQSPSFSLSPYPKNLDQTLLSHPVLLEIPSRSRFSSYSSSSGPPPVFTTHPNKFLLDPGTERNPFSPHPSRLLLQPPPPVLHTCASLRG